MDQSQVKAVEKAIDYMRHNLSQDLTSEQIAHYVGYSPYHFTRMFRKLVGVPPRLYLSALRIEASKQSIYHAASLLKTSLTVGFQSFGTFSSRFKRNVGLSPKGFSAALKKGLPILEGDSQERSMEGDNPVYSELNVRIDTPENFSGVLFVGLFPRPIPDQRPIRGVALTTGREHTFRNLPAGRFYLLAAAISIPSGLRDYYINDRSLRAKLDEPVTIGEGTSPSCKLTLREPHPLDPPILINLPNLLISGNKIAREKKFPPQK